MTLLVWLFLASIAPASAVPLYYCNTKNLTALMTGVGNFFFDSRTSLTWDNSWDKCRNWAIPSGYQNATFASGDVMNIPNQTMIMTNLASLWNMDNFNMVKAYTQGNLTSFWLGLSQSQVKPAVTTALSGIYEPAYNWTWTDGTPLLRDTKGEGLVYFSAGQPDNGGATKEHYGGWYWNYNLFNDFPGDYLLPAICSIPRRTLG
jgi:hypothetical protein